MQNAFWGTHLVPTPGTRWIRYTAPVPKVARVRKPEPPIWREARQKMGWSF